MIGYDGKPVSNGGKGSKTRYTDKKKYDKNYDAIDWGRGKRAHKPTSPSGTRSPLRQWW
tara:strand:+ start:5818 stop:5994 length:177 start_codon:yes stop_codon:yes gene_type:complete